MDLQANSDIHVYRINAANRAVGLALPVVLLCFALFCNYHLVRLGRSTTFMLEEDLFIFLPLFVLGLFTAIQLRRMRVTITKTQVEVAGVLFTHIIPFTEISGRRNADPQGGIFLYRHGKSRVWLRGWIQQDEFFRQWRDSIYDLDKADRLKRRADARERLMDRFAKDNSEQDPTIGGPDTLE